MFKRLSLMQNIVLAAIAYIVVTVAPAADAEPLTTDRGLTYSEWLPANFSDHNADVPLIIFSHGFGGCAQQSRTLTQALANAGYAVVAPNHRDQACQKYVSGIIGGIVAEITGDGPEKSFGSPERWDSSTEIGRRNDVDGLLSYVLSREPYKHAIDSNRIGIMGHSLGGYTALGMAGGWPAWHNPQFKAVLVMAPYASPFVVKGALGNIAVPVMYMAGTSDGLISDADVMRAYKATKARKYFVVLKGAGHFAYTELSKSYQQTIASYAVAFFDRELRNQSAPILNRSGGEQVQSYSYTR